MHEQDTTACRRCGEPIVRSCYDGNRPRTYCGVSCRDAARVGRVSPKRTPAYPVGAVIGAWTVVEEAAPRQERRSIALFYRCRCACGVERLVEKKALHRGTTRSCRCQAKLTHGDTRDGRTESLYRIWTHMRGRCQRPTDSAYPNYGGRGIIVCAEWDRSYPAFRAWAIAAGYRPDLSIDRIDNDGSYSPQNCRWATTAEQSLNTRRNRRLTAFGITKTLKEWAADPRCLVSYYTLRSRLRYGWAIVDALTLPHQPTTGHQAASSEG